MRISLLSLSAATVSWGRSRHSLGTCKVGILGALVAFRSLRKAVLSRERKTTLLLYGSAVAITFVTNRKFGPIHADNRRSPLAPGSRLWRATSVLWQSSQPGKERVGK